MIVMSKPRIDGLEAYEQLHRLPKETVRRRKTKYDQVITDAKKSPRRLVFENDERATNVYVALRARIKRDKENLKVRKRDLEVYVFAVHPTIKAGVSKAKILGGMKSAKMRTGISR